DRRAEARRDAEDADQRLVHGGRTGRDGAGRDTRLEDGPGGTRSGERARRALAALLEARGCGTVGVPVGRVALNGQAMVAGPALPVGRAVGARRQAVALAGELVGHTVPAEAAEDVRLADAGAARYVDGRLRDRAGVEHEADRERADAE